MNEELAEAYTSLPAAESCRLVRFDRAEVVTPESFPPQHLLTLGGTEPLPNVEVDLAPLAFVRQPEYRYPRIPGVQTESEREGS